MKLIDSILTQAAGIASIRRDLHAHPELCFQEVRTADLVAAKLTEWGIEFERARAVLAERDPGGFIDALLADGDADEAWEVANTGDREIQASARGNPGGAAPRARWYGTGQLRLFGWRQPQSEREFAHQPLPARHRVGDS